MAVSLLARPALLATFAVIAVACGANATPTPSPTATQSPTPAPSLRQVAVGTEFTLTVGEQVEVADRQVILTFVGVSNDSRCPIDVVCVRAGEAVADFSWEAPDFESAAFDLYYGEGENEVWGFGLAFRLTGVQPAAVSTTSIPPDAYQVTVRLGLFS